MITRYCVWDAPDDPDGNVQHIAANGVSVAEFEEVLRSPAAVDGLSRQSGLPARFGWTGTGRHLMVIYKILDEAEGFQVVEPVTAFAVPPRSSRRP